MSDKPLIEVVDSIGMARDLLEDQGHLKPYSCWMGVSTNKRAYPDEDVIKFAKWGSEHSEKFYLLLADRLQLYNKVPFSRMGWSKLDSDEYVKAAQKRKAELENLVVKNKLGNIEIKLIEFEFIPLLRSSSESLSLMIDWSYQFFNQKTFDNPGLEHAIEQVTEEKAGKLLEQAKDKEISQDHALFAFSRYTHLEVFFSWLFAELEVAPIKIGPLWEKPYDTVTLDIVKGKYGAFSGKDKRFGAVYLGPKSEQLSPTFHKGLQSNLL